MTCVFYIKPVKSMIYNESKGFVLFFDICIWEHNGKKLIEV